MDFMNKYMEAVTNYVNQYNNQVAKPNLDTEYNTALNKTYGTGANSWADAVTKYVNEQYLSPYLNIPGNLDSGKRVKAGTTAALGAKTSLMGQAPTFRMNPAAAPDMGALMASIMSKLGSQFYLDGNGNMMQQNTNPVGSSATIWDTIFPGQFHNAGRGGPGNFSSPTPFEQAKSSLGPFSGLSGYEGRSDPKDVNTAVGSQTVPGSSAYNAKDKKSRKWTKDFLSSWYPGNLLGSVNRPYKGGK